MTHESELNLFSSILNISKDNRRGDVYKRAITSMIIIWNLKFKGIAQNIVHKKKFKKNPPSIHSRWKILWWNKKSCMRDASIRLKTARISGANQRFGAKTVLEWFELSHRPPCIWEGLLVGFLCKQTNNEIYICRYELISCTYKIKCENSPWINCVPPPCK